MGTHAGAVGREVAHRRLAGERAAGFVGSDELLATTMAEEMLGGLDELVVLPGDGPPAGGAGVSSLLGDC